MGPDLGPDSADPWAHAPAPSGAEGHLQGRRHDGRHAGAGGSDLPRLRAPAGGGHQDEPGQADASPEDRRNGLGDVKEGGEPHAGEDPSVPCRFAGKAPTLQIQHEYLFTRSGEGLCPRAQVNLPTPPTSHRDLEERRPICLPARASPRAPGRSRTSLPTSTCQLIGSLTDLLARRAEDSGLWAPPQARMPAGRSGTPAEVGNR
jgi:hypothetical protein